MTRCMGRYAAAHTSVMGKLSTRLWPMTALGRVADQVHFAPFPTLAIAQSSYVCMHRLWQCLLPPSMRCCFA